MHYHGHRARLRAKLLQDPAALPDYELLELLLGLALTRADTKPLAKELLQRFQSLRGALYAPEPELLALPGFGPALAAHWTLLRESMARCAEAPLRERAALNSAEEVASFARQRLAGLNHEEVWIAFVDARNRSLAWEKSAGGGAGEALLPVREILGRALSLRASGFILVHNHPGGSPEPSKTDLAATREILRGAQALGLRFIDHLIIAGDEIRSILREVGPPRPHEGAKGPEAP